LKVTILGSGGSAVSAKRACPSIVVDESIAFDFGPGSLRNLRVSRIPTEKLSKVFISHTHAGHTVDLVPFLWAIQIDGRKAPLELYGPPGFKSIFQKLLECTNTNEGFFKFPLSISEVDFGTRIHKISTCRTSHSIPTLAFRVEKDGKSFCYSADTIYCPAVVELARDVDLLLHEATFLQDQLPIAQLTCHSTGEMAGRGAKEATAKRLMLFHIPPPNEHREEEFRTDALLAYGKEVIVSTDLASIEF
jgi:ribonuclease BN (tRNA processing enzyme)